MLIVSCDLGQANDYTALCVVEAKAERLDLRHLGRIRHLDYPAIAQQIGRLYHALPHPKRLLLDNTGVGRAVADLLADCEPVRITITSGRHVNRTPEGWNVPKAELVQSLAGALESGYLRIAEGLDYESELKAELAGFKAKIQQSGHCAFGGVGQHDDFVTSLAQAVWFSGLITGQGGTSGT